MTRTWQLLASTLLCALLCTPASCDLDTATQACNDGLRCPTGAQCTADGMACITDACGNGDIDPGELCDDGNNRSGDGCRADCLSDEPCGNGERDVGEPCDDGNQVTGDGCSPDCKLESCGNGQRDSGEVCDDGADSAVCDRDCSLPACADGVFNPLAEDCESFGFDTATCNVDCTLSVCGDGHPNLAATELCDAAGASATCDADCTLARCGDGIVNADQGEECDSGGVNTVDCNFDCTLPRCGDGILNLLANEECDDNDLINDICRGNCRLATAGGDRCGNGRTDPSLEADRFEQCDDFRDGDDGDECTDECTFGPTVIHDDGLQQSQECDVLLHGPFACDADYTFRFCGDGFINRAAGEQCDNGDRLADNAHCSDCMLVNCGDGARGPYEQCDDGNRVPGDGCTADCQKECGNGSIDAGEHCDDGNLDDGDECTNDCTFGRTVLLDNDVREGQECAPILDGPEACERDHTFAKCGDGFLNEDIGEECDDGNGSSGDGCSATCANECGDGNRGRFEQCDDGNDVDDDACKNDCTFGPTVILDNDLREGDECVPAIDGTNACDPDHTRVVCGDGFKNVDAGEDCDDGNLFAGDGCSVDCKRERCGNGRIDGAEQCDGDIGGQDTCRNDCEFGAVVNLGDDVRQANECVPLLGELCDPDFTFPRCGDRFVNAAADEQCDDGNDAPGDGCSPECQLEPNDLPIGG